MEGCAFHPAGGCTGPLCGYETHPEDYPAVEKSGSRKAERRNLSSGQGAQYTRKDSEDIAGRIRKLSAASVWSEESCSSHVIDEMGPAESEDSCPYFVEGMRGYVLKGFFGRTRSRLTGRLMRVPIPHRIRAALFRALLNNPLRASPAGEAALNEIERPLTSYKSLSEFFSRSLRPSSRRPETFDPNVIVSPCDGVVAHLETIPEPHSDVWLTQIKGAKYKAKQFLGRPLCSGDSWSRISTSRSTSHQVILFEQCPNCLRSLPTGGDQQSPVRQDESSLSLKRSPSGSTRAATTEGSSALSICSSCARRSAKGLQWYHCVLYLAPKNYHHFHAPCDMSVTRRRHFVGEVMPVFRPLASRLNNLFAVNERVILEGQWYHGNIFMNAIAAYNVADIKLTSEPTLSTNVPSSVHKQKVGHVDVAHYLTTKNSQSNCCRACEPRELDLPEESRRGCVWKRGDEVGEFRLGSTVTLIFEAPAETEWLVRFGDSIRVGQSILRCFVE